MIVSTNELPTVSVVIVTRDRPEVIAECLDRLQAEEGVPFATIVVDTSSTIRTQKILRKYPDVKNCYLGDMPYSMVRSRNVGLSIARSDIVAFIDDDCYVRKGWLRALTEVFDNPDVVAAGGRIIYHPWAKTKRGGPISTVDLQHDLIAGEWDRIVDKPVEVPTLPGGNCAVRRNIALEIGGFDTNFVGSANLEETDFFFRVKQHTDGRLLFVSSAVVEHRAAPRSDRIVRSHTNFVYRYSQVRNRLYFLRKHNSPVLISATVRQLKDFVVGTGRFLLDTGTFAGASLAGIVAGLTVPAVGKKEGLSSPEDGQERMP